MSYFEFLKYEATPGEKHMGIATVKLYGKVILRYKISPSKDGKSFYPNPASYKMPTPPGDKDRYIQAFLLDSQADKEELDELIKEKVNEILNTKTQVTQGVSNKSPQHQDENMPF